MKSTFDKRLKEALMYRKLSPAQLSERTGIAKSSISRYLSGNYRAGQKSTKILADALGVDEGWLMGGDCGMFPHRSEDFLIDGEERILIENYRKADNEKKRLIAYVLGLQDK